MQQMRSLPSNRLLLLIALGLLVAQVTALLSMGRSVLCPCGYISLWYANPSGTETSQHLTDWYTFSHIVHGFGLYGLLWLAAPRLPVGVRLVLALGVEVGWEIVENTPLVIDRYRQAALAQGYVGDSLVNSLSDTFSAIAGFLLARSLPVWASIAVVVGIEAGLAFMIRDNFTLNVIQLIGPFDAISQWQIRN